MAQFSRRSKDGQRYPSLRITAIHYNTRCIFILKILTHADCSKDRWKNDL